MIKFVGNFLLFYCDRLWSPFPGMDQAIAFLAKEGKAFVH